MRRVLMVISIIAAIGILVGCATIDDPLEVRREHIRSFGAEVREREKERLSAPLKLNDCILIALRQNYKVKQAELNKKLALMNKDMSFANFLPYIDMSAKLTTWSHQPMAFGSFTQDKTVRTVDIGGAMPILMPSVWLMYANAKLGLSVADLSSHYICQSVILDTSVAFFLCLNAEDNIATLETQVAATESQAKRIGGMVKEGLVASWQGEQADYLLRALPVVAKHGVERLFIYEFRAPEKVADDRESHFGIVHADFTPKAAYRALADRAAKQGKGGR